MQLKIKRLIISLYATQKLDDFSTFFTRNKSLLLVLLITASSTLALAQGRRYRYIGLQPSLNAAIVNLDFPPKSMDFNVAPLTFQTPINEVTDFKILSIANYKWNDELRLSAVGLQVVFPRYFKAKQRFSEKSKGWYLGPSIGTRRSFYSNQYHVSPGLEYGRTFSGEGLLSANLSLQFGADYNIRINQTNTINPYAAVALGFGLWTKKAIAIRGGAI